MNKVLAVLQGVMLLVGLPWPGGHGQSGGDGPNATERKNQKVVNSIGMQFIRIPAGEFLMGAPEAEKGHGENEVPQHRVKISRPFWLGVHEVTQIEYEQVMGYHDSDSHRSSANRGGKNRLDTSRFPVDEISWYQAAEFCNRLSEEEGLPPFYKLSPSKLGKQWKDVIVIGGPGYRLPTEAEWEYACRAGTTTAFSFGDTIQPGEGNVGRHIGGLGYSSHAAAVGSFPANAFGLHDMHGNVAEWCNDVYDRRNQRSSCGTRRRARTSRRFDRISARSITSRSARMGRGWHRPRAGA